MKLFDYICPYIANNTRNYTAGTVDGIRRDFGERVNRDNIANGTYQDIYNKDSIYEECWKHEIALGLRLMSDILHDSGDIIICNLKKC